MVGGCISGVTHITRGRNSAVLLFWMEEVSPVDREESVCSVGIVLSSSSLVLLSSLSGDEVFEEVEISEEEVDKEGEDVSGSGSVE